MKAIAAVSENFGIGRGNELLFNIPEDKRFFKSQTLGGTVVMGRKTFLSLPNGPFKDRENIVLTRDPLFTAEGIIVCRSREELDALLAEKDGDSVWVVGGGEIYSQLIGSCDQLVLTRISAAADADVFFPDIDSDPSWILAEQTDEKEYNGLHYRFCTYVRTKQ